MQSPAPPNLKENACAEILFNFENNKDSSTLLLQYKRLIIEVSNGFNITKEDRGFYNKMRISIL